MNTLLTSAMALGVVFMLGATQSAEASPSQSVVSIPSQAYVIPAHGHGHWHGHPWHHYHPYGYGYGYWGSPYYDYDYDYDYDGGASLCLGGLCLGAD